MEKCGCEYSKPAVSIGNGHLTDNQCQFTVTVDFHSTTFWLSPEIVNHPPGFDRITTSNQLLE